MDKYYAAIDLGTTTVEVSLLQADGSVVAKHGFLNPQKKYGSDVISRVTWQIRHSEDPEITDCVAESIRDALEKMLSWHRGTFPGDIEKAVVTGNTAMAAIFMGYYAGSLGHAPFLLPYDETEDVDLSGIPCTVPAPVSAVLGSDSVGGAWALPLGEDELLMDLGTNGEMLLRHDGVIHGATAACGPAFENCTRAQGIYGSTMLAAIGRLLKRKKLPADGTLPQDVAERGIYDDGTVPEPGKEKAAGKMLITPKILQEVQMAKAAIRATFSMLCRRAGVEEKNLKSIRLAGGFGFHMSLRDAVTIGILPEFLSERVKISGNTSLLAAEKMALEGMEEYEHFREKVITYQFGGDPEYEELFYRSIPYSEQQS